MPSKKPLGRYCSNVDAQLTVGWKSVGGGDGIGGKAPRQADNVDVVAFSDYILPGYEAGCALLARTTIFDMVKECVEGAGGWRDGIIRGKKNMADFMRLANRLKDAANYIEAHMSNPTGQGMTHETGKNV